MSHIEVLADYEDLEEEEEDLLASLQYAVELSKVKRISKLVA